ncbi:MAG: hypothetical protein IT488_05050 [Gammaproteobacteria bacterium]|nr:hypothetical protein [Gammaproteobacteria bacterium]
MIAKTPASGGGDSDTYDLVYPKGLNDSERVEVKKLMDGLPSELAQQLLDELAGRMETRAIHTSPLAYLRGLVTRASAGKFTPEMALRIADRRKRQRQIEAALRQNDTRHGQALQHASITAHLAKDNPLVKRLMAIQDRAKQRNTKEE